RIENTAAKLRSGLPGAGGAPKRGRIRDGDRTPRRLELYHVIAAPMSDRAGGPVARTAGGRVRDTGSTGKTNHENGKRVPELLSPENGQSMAQDRDRGRRSRSDQAVP